MINHGIKTSDEKITCSFYINYIFYIFDSLSTSIINYYEQIKNYKHNLQKKFTYDCFLRLINYRFY